MSTAKTGLHLGDGFVMPMTAVTEPIGIFANRGKGKSSSARRFVEQLYAAGLPSVVLDIKGDWYGIRSSADGRSEGLPFVVFGGEHGDVPLEPGSGPVVARFLADARVPAVVDMSNLSKTKARYWVMEFAETLYQVNRDPLMLVVDEADVLIPQRLSADLMRLLGAMEDIAKRGRQRGLGITVISQRVADVNKSVTDLLETLLIFALTGTRTRKAILDWIDDHADPEEAKAVVATLSTLERGECWVWSPSFLRILRRVSVAMFETFDSFATPEPGQARRVPKKLADIDLAALSEEIRATVERAQADDPKALRARIAEMERELAALRAAPAPAAEPVEVPVLTADDWRRVDELLAYLTDMGRSLADCRDAVAAVVGKVAAAVAQVSAAPPAVPRSPVEVVNPVPETAARSVERAARRIAADEGADAPLSTSERRLLNALVLRGPTLRRQSLGAIAGYSWKSGGFRNSLSRLRVQGFIEGSDPVTITDAGRAALGDIDELPTGRALLDFWQSKLGKAERTIAEALMGVYPDTMTRSDCAATCGYTVTSGGFRNALSKLRTLGLIDAGDPLRASDALGGS